MQSESWEGVLCCGAIARARGIARQTGVYMWLCVIVYVCVCVGVGVGVCVCAHMCGCACLAVVEVARIDGMYPRQISISWWIGSTAILHV